MRVPLLIAAALCLVARGAPAAGELARQAAEAVAGHQLVEARTLYRTLAERDPTNVDYQIWVARLSSWLNDYVTANATFDRVLAADATNVEALVGKAYIAMWQEQFGEADDLLSRAERAAPENLEVQLGLARSCHFQGRDREAADHVGRVLGLDPGNPDAQELQRRLAPEPKRLGFFAKLKRILTGRS